MVNITINPRANLRKDFIIKDPPYVVPNHENILIPVGTAIIKVAAVK